uniref:MARVEL domain-containing protein n=1 Tax=Panagrolaimus superbus TaxID=310955 RepID=A0A914Z3K6_9BILA
MNFIKKLIPQTTPRPQNYHHYVCFGNAHVKFATFIIIVIRLCFTILSAYYFMTGHVFYRHTLDIIYDCIEVLVLIFLIIGYINEDSKWTWPYMAIEFTWLILVLIVYAISITAIIFPSRFSGWWTYQDKIVSDPSKIRKYAFRTCVESAIAVTLCAFEISILLACNRYFDDEKARKKDLRERPIILNQDGSEGGSHQSAIIDMEPVLNTTVSVDQQQRQQNRGFANPNFSLVDSDDENDHDHDWHSKDKKANILA